VANSARLLDIFLIRGLVIGGCAAGLAIHQAIFANADVELRLAEHAELIALALVFLHFALHATEFSVACSSGRMSARHTRNVARCGKVEYVPLVTQEGSGFLIVNCLFPIANFQLSIESSQICFEQLTIGTRQSAISSVSYNSEQ
jgi:hypothetical protein